MAQFAGFGLALVAVALWLLDVPGLSGSLPTKPEIDDPGARSAKPEIVRVRALDREASLGIGERLEVAANRPPKIEEPQANTQGQEPEPPPSATEWKYLGSIEEPTRLLALVSLKGKQKIVSEGMELKILTPAAEGRPESVDYAAKIVTIKKEHIVVEEEGGAKRTIPLESKTARVAWVKNMPTTVQGTSTSMAAGAMSAEARQRLVAQGIDPAAAERARQAAMAAARNRTAAATPAPPPGNMFSAASQAATQAGDAVKPDPTSSRTRAIPRTDADADSASSGTTSDDGAKGSDTSQRSDN